MERAISGDMGENCFDSVDILWVVLDEVKLASKEVSREAGTSG